MQVRTAEVVDQRTPGFDAAVPLVAFEVADKIEVVGLDVGLVAHLAAELEEDLERGLAADLVEGVVADLVVNLAAEVKVLSQLAVAVVGHIKQDCFPEWAHLAGMP